MNIEAKERIKERAARLPIARALERFGADHLWGLIYTVDHVERRLSWAMALVDAKQYKTRAAYQTLVELYPLIRELDLR